MNLFLSAALLLQEAAAEQALAQIEETLKKAPGVVLTLKTEYQSVLKEQPFKSEALWKVVLGTGNKVRVESQPQPGMAWGGYLFISDGENILMRRNDQGHFDPAAGVVVDPEKRNRAMTPPDLTSRLVSAWVQIGVMGVTPILDASLVPARSAAGRGSSGYQRCALRAGPDEQKAKTLTYDLTRDGGSAGRPEVMIWYDPTTFLPLKRSFSYREDSLQQRNRTIETVEATRLEEDAAGVSFDIPKPTPQEQLEICRDHLRQLWALQTVYTQEFGGRMREMPPLAGPAFWLALAKTPRPILESWEHSLLACPFAGAGKLPDVKAYRGPSVRIGMLAGDDPVGCCEPGQHPDGTITVLQKSGKLRIVGPDQPLYKRAMETTTSTSGSLEKK